MSPPRPHEVTFEDWSALDEDDMRELVDGVLVEGEMASFVHDMIVLWLGAALRAWLVPRHGYVAGSTVKLKVSNRRGRMPDLIAYFERAAIVLHGVQTNPPSIAIEVVSAEPSDERRDRVDKLAEYAAFGIRYYWLVSPAARLIEILELGADGRYVHAQALATGTAAIVGCEGLTLDLDELWREVDSLENPTPAES